MMMAKEPDFPEEAVLAERERCAKIADATQMTYSPERFNEMAGYNACRSIAAAIRSGK